MAAVGGEQRGEAEGSDATVPFLLNDFWSI